MSVMPAPVRIRLDALIEEARRRARMRRLAYSGAIALAAGGAIAAGLAFSGAPASPKAPPGFTVVRARGPVTHAFIESSPGVRITNLAGQDRPVKRVEEIWYDARGGLWHVVVRIDGRVRIDRAGACKVHPKVPCGWSEPLSYLRPFEWPLGLHGYRVTGRGTFRGLPVIWLKLGNEFLGVGNQGTQQVGLDPRTRTPVVERYLFHGRVTAEIVISRRSSLSAGSFSFVLRKGAAAGPPDDSSDPYHGTLLAYGFAAARTALGATPLWLGPRFRGYELRSVQTGTYPFGRTKTGALKKAPFVRFYYGTPVDEDYRFSVEEFGSIRPGFYAQGPRPGEIERDQTYVARLTRGGLLLRVEGSPSFRLTARNAVAVAKGLRPLPAGLENVPTLRQQ